MAPIGLKLCQNAFQTIPGILCFDAKNANCFSICSQTLNGCLPLKDGSNWAETLPKRVSDDSRRFVFSAKKEIGQHLSIWRGFCRATAEPTSKSASSSNFALDRRIQRSVCPKNLGFGEVLGFPKIFTSVAGVRFPCGIKSTA